jgi:hypothetical protein
MKMIAHRKRTLEYFSIYFEPVPGTRIASRRKDISLNKNSKQVAIVNEQKLTL